MILFPTEYVYLGRIGCWICKVMVICWRTPRFEQFARRHSGSLKLCHRTPRPGFSRLRREKILFWTSGAPELQLGPPLSLSLTRGPTYHLLPPLLLFSSSIAEQQPPSSTSPGHVGARMSWRAAAVAAMRALRLPVIGAPRPQSGHGGRCRCRGCRGGPPQPQRWPWKAAAPPLHLVLDRRYRC